MRFYGWSASAIIACLFSVTTVYALPAFPGAEGFGSDTVHGSGRHMGTPATTVYKVTNLNDSGAGSLRACIEASGPRTCIFETSGAIVPLSAMNINNDYLTIAGHTAPSPGISIHGDRAELIVDANNLLIQHIRIRVGDEPFSGCDDRDGLSHRRGDNVVYDHLTVSWAIDENIALYSFGGQYQQNVTLSNTMSHEALANSCHSKGLHSMGLLMGRGGQMSAHNNLLAHNNARNPLYRSGSDNVSNPLTSTYVNNVIYNPGTNCFRQMNIGTPPDANEQAQGVVPLPFTASFLGNYMKKGANSSTYLPMICIDSAILAGSNIWVDDNEGPGRTADPFSVVDAEGSSGQYLTKPPAANPVTYSPATIRTALAAFDHVMLNVGARPADRDANEIRIISEVQNGTGQHRDCLEPARCPNNVGGMPTVAVNTRTLTVPSNKDEVQPSGYTRLEEWLHTFYADVEPQPGGTGVARIRGGRLRGGRVR